MKDISSIQKSNNLESPKTPGGISKSFLTPCRRVGLSRNWRKSGTSPFISPLSSADKTDVKQEPTKKKRKCSTNEDSLEVLTAEENNVGEPCTSSNSISADSTRTPTRNLIPRKKSKTLLLTNDECEDEKVNIPINNNIEEKLDIKIDKSSKNVKITKLSRCKSKNKSEKVPIKDPSLDMDLNKLPICKTTCEENKQIDITQNLDIIESNKKSPDNLTKECIVVIQKKIFKTDCDMIKPEKTPTQALFDSDSDDVPLCNINKMENRITLINDDDEFEEKKTIIKNPQKTPSTELKNTKKVKEKIKTPINKTEIKTDNKLLQKSSFDDDDDFISDKKTILIKKTYNKVAKLSKSRSTGSITQKDIDELIERIESKKNLLLAKAMTNETAELRNLIKKWQKGCQNALSELLELMKTKMPEQKMNYSEILQGLKIPPDLVGYDSENDIFNTPDDANIILSDFNI